MKQNVIERIMAEGKTLYPDKEEEVVVRINELKKQLAVLEKWLEESRRRRGKKK